MSAGPREQADARIEAIAAQLRELADRLGTAASADVQVSLLERATALAEEATRLLEQVAGETS